MLLKVIFAILLAAATTEPCAVGEVERGVLIPLNSSQSTVDLTILTDSVIGDAEWIYVWFYDANSRWAGGVGVSFSWPPNPVKWSLLNCNMWTDFDVELPTQRFKTWRIVYTPALRRIVYYCNEVEVKVVELSAKVCNLVGDGLEYTWNLKPTQIKFDSERDEASNKYCEESEPPVVVDGGINEWSEWSECSKECGGGATTRTRTCTNPKPEYGGYNCKDLALEESLNCNDHRCTGCREMKEMTGYGVETRRRYRHNEERLGELKEKCLENNCAAILCKKNKRNTQMKCGRTPRLVELVEKDGYTAYIPVFTCIKD